MSRSTSFCGVFTPLFNGISITQFKFQCFIKYRVIVYNCRHRFLSLFNNWLYFKYFLAYLYSLEYVDLLYWIFVFWIESKGIFMRVEKSMLFSYSSSYKTIWVKFISKSWTKNDPLITHFIPIMFGNHPTIFLQNMIHVGPILTEI